MSLKGVGRDREQGFKLFHFCDDWTVTENPSTVDRSRPSTKDIHFDKWLSCVYFRCIEEQSNWITSCWRIGIYPGICLDWVVIDISASYIMPGIPYFSQKIETETRISPSLWERFDVVKTLFRCFLDFKQRLKKECKLIASISYYFFLNFVTFNGFVKHQNL